MDGRWKLFAGGLIVSGLMGCTMWKPKPILPDSPPPPVSTAKNSVFVPEPTDEGELKEGPLASSTTILFANMWVEAVAKDPNKPAADREALLAKARGVYQDILSREPNNVDALLGLGEMYQVAGEIDKLREVEKKATSLHPKNPKVWAWVAVRQARAKNFDEAAESYHQAVKLEPDNRMYRIHLGFTLARGGRYAEGFEWLSRSMREAEARFNVAQMMIHNGDIEKAKLELRLSLKADPNFKAAGDQLTAIMNPNAPPGTDIRTVGHKETNNVIPPIQVERK
jgi:tetratricopeptide (TPR) repeat protein